MISESNNKTIGMLYVHIPFCGRKCPYCDFLSFPIGATDKDGNADVCGRPYQLSVTGNQWKQDYLKALLAEIKSSGEENPFQEVSSVFFGGGTPSLLTGEELQQVMAALRQHFPLQEEAEITLEMNPGTITEEKVKAWKKAGINRISMGAQSLDNERLQALGRIHTKEEILSSVHMIREVGFTNYSLDLMFGLPGQTMTEWRETLGQAVALEPTHLSCYSLILEEGTSFYEKKEQLNLPSEDVERDMYYETVSYLAQQGYHRYEISNFAKPGYESRHNTGYWRRIPYLGLGLGAASLTSGQERYTNTSSMDIYLKQNAVLSEIQESRETLSVSDQMAETLFLGLRLACGVSYREFQQQFGRSLEEVYGAVINKYTDLGLLKREGGCLRLTDRGIDVSNVIFADFLPEEDA